MGKSRRTVIISVLLTASCGVAFQIAHVSAAARASSIQTNSAEYQANDTVIVTGFGWKPNAPITLIFHELVEKPFHADVVISTFADEGGVIDTSRHDTSDDDFQLDEHDLGVTYQLTATGYTAFSELASVHTTFTDAAAVNPGTEASLRVSLQP